MQQRLKIAVVGIGYLGRHHARILSALPEVQLSGVIDVDEGLSAEAASLLSTKGFKDYRDALSQTDALCIVTPTDTHYEIALECLAYNKHLFIEKPVTSRVTEAMELAKIASSKGLIIQVGHIERFNPVYIALKETIGSPVFFETERVSPFLQRAANVDVVKDLMIHDIDLILSLLKARGIDRGLKKVDADGLRLVTNRTDLAIARLEFISGVKAILKAGRVAKDKGRKMTVYEDQGLYYSIDFNQQKLTAFSGTDCSFHETVCESPEELLRVELNAFVHAVHKGIPPEVSIGDAIDALSVVEAINDSIGACK